MSDKKLSEKQIEALRQLAVESRTRVPWSTLKALTDRGLLRQGRGAVGWALTEAGVEALGKDFDARAKPVTPIEDAQRTRKRDPFINIFPQARILTPEAEAVIADFVKLDRGDGAVFYAKMDGRHVRVELRDLAPRTLDSYEFTWRTPPAPHAMASQDPGQEAPL